jgi:hypothetical protein
MNNDLAMYGVDDMKAYFEDAKTSTTYRFAGGFMLIASLMSDAQELIAMGQSEAARLELNKAKYLLFKTVSGELNLKEGELA